MTLPKLGNKAPAFTLHDQDNKIVNLKDFAGKKVVLYFYPKAMTPGCTTQACGMRDYAAEYAKRNAVVFGISPDPVDKLKKFADKYGLEFGLLSDEDHGVADKYGVWGLKKFMGREFMGVNRMTFIVDESGKLAHIAEKVKTKTHHEDILAILTSL